MTVPPLRKSRSTPDLLQAIRECFATVVDTRTGCDIPLVTGNVGGGGCQSYTVHGDVVNLAARLEALCKEHGTSVLLSASTAKVLPHAKLIAVGDIAVRSLTEPVTVFSMPADGA